MEFHKPGANKRVFAFLLDSLIAYGIGILLWIVGIKIIWLFWTAYILFKDIYNGKSIGKLCADMLIIDEKGEPANFVQTVKRNTLMIIPLFPLVEYFVMVNDDLGRRMGDKIAKTKVHDLQPVARDRDYFLYSVICLIFLICAAIFVQLFILTGRR